MLPLADVRRTSGASWRRCKYTVRPACLPTSMSVNHAIQHNRAGTTRLALMLLCASCAFPAAPVLVNSGGGAYTDSHGQVWSADFGYVDGGSYCTTAAISNTADPTLYQCEHWGSGYLISLPNGSYTVTLKFAEIFYTGAGQRVFSVALNQTTVVESLDIFSAAGGANRAYDVTFPVTVSSFGLSVAFRALAGIPKVNAIEIVQQQPLFSRGTTFATGNGPQFVAAADFNQDGFPDLAIANTPDKTVTIMLGNGAGGFAPGSVLQTGFIPYSLAVGDFNNDTFEDLAVVTDGDVRIFLGDGRGGFSPSGTPYLTGISPLFAAVGDFDKNGNLDIAVVNAGSNTVTLLLGNGQGTFVQSGPFSTGRNPYGIAVGDFNGDGKPDLAVANWAENTVTVLLADGKGGFTESPGSPFAAGSGPIQVNVSDFNGDGVQDLAITNYCNAVPGCTSATILLGDGRGGFSLSSQPGSAGALILGTAVADFNGDGIPDLATVNFNGLSVLLGTGYGTFIAPGQNMFAAGANPYALAVADFNSDGKLDIAVVNQGSNNLVVFLGTQSTLARPNLVSPTIGATGIDVSAALQWNASSGATSYDVYFGSSSTPPFVANTTATAFRPPSVALSTTYYWRIVARNGIYSASSLLWSFTTQGTSVPAALIIKKTHSGNFTQGQLNASYVVTVSNAGNAGSTRGSVTVSEAIPPGLTLISMSGSGWSCAANTCTRSEELNPGMSYPDIGIVVNVNNDAPAEVTNSVTVSGGGSALANASDVTPIEPAPTGLPIRINAGGGTYTDSLIQTWSADFGYVDGGSYCTTVSISNTTDPKLYQCEHWGSGYQFSVPNGSYTVTLKFAEIWYTSAGQRVFNVVLNGTTVLSGLDVFSAAGGANRAYDVSFPVLVSNGEISIGFQAVIGLPKVNAIQIVQGQSTSFPPVRVDSGGGTYADSLNQTWSADFGYVDGGSYCTAATISNTADPKLYQCEHWGSGYQFSVPNGTYTVTLKFAEIWYTSAGQRVFNVALNGTTVLSGLDVFSAAGGADRAYDVSFPVSVSNGEISIAFQAVIGLPKVNAIQIE